MMEEAKVRFERQPDREVRTARNHRGGFRRDYCDAFTNDSARQSEILGRMTAHWETIHLDLSRPWRKVKPFA